jgi:pSer/pThr/pTyr-binding forkhead associated (FHA) protein
MPYLLYLDSGLDLYIPNTNVIRLTKEVYTIGRAPERDIVVDCIGVSRLHCTLLMQEGSYFLVDGDGTSKSSLNGTSILSRAAKVYCSSAVPLSDRDVIMLGGKDFFEYFADDLTLDEGDEGTGVPARLPRYPGGLSTAS